MPPHAQPLPDRFRGPAFATNTSGLSPDRLRRADLWSPHRGVRVLRGGDGDWTSLAQSEVLVARCRALATVLPDGVGFGSLTAAALWPLPLPTAASVPVAALHVAALGSAWAPRRAGVVARQISDGHAFLVTRHDLPCLDPATLWCHLGLVLSRTAMIVVGDALVHRPVGDPGERPFVRHDDLRDRVDAYRGRGKHRLRALVPRLRPGSESPMETRLRLLIVDGGLPEPTCNVDIHAADGRFLGRGDLVYEEFCVIVEYDGDHHRTDRATFDRDLRRLDDLAAHGWRVVRVAGPSFHQEPDAVLRRIRRALVAGGWKGLA